jgi:hypothetical protein
MELEKQPGDTKAAEGVGIGMGIGIAIGAGVGGAIGAGGKG